jgi:L-threonylcarbamoyladenylate synthase
MPQAILTTDVDTTAQSLTAGGVIAYPTEAVYGLGCDPLNASAVNKLLHIKNRPTHKGFILLAAHWQQLEPFIAPLTPAQHARAQATWPGPFTWLMPATDSTPATLSVDQLIAVRITNHPLARQLCLATQCAIISTSANLAEQPPMTEATQVAATLGQQLDTILVGATGQASQSTPIRNIITGAWLRNPVHAERTS